MNQAEQDELNEAKHDLMKAEMKLEVQSVKLPFLLKEQYWKGFWTFAWIDIAWRICKVIWHFVMDVPPAK